MNNARNLALKIHSLTVDADVRKIFSVLIENYMMTARDTLRDQVQIAQLRECKTYSHSYYNPEAHLPNQVMKAMYAETISLYRSGRISGEQFLFINAELQSFTDNMGVCEWIKKNSHSVFLQYIY